MNLRILTAGCLVVCSMLPLSALAAEPHLEFVQGLRNRQYYDYALYYLEQLDGRQDIPDEVRQVLPFEKALTLLQSARTLRSPEAQNQQLNEAAAFLDQFVKDNPQHPLAAKANAERGNIQLNKARVEIWQSRSPTNQGNRAEYQQRGRALVEAARKIFQAAHDQYEQEWKSYGVYIDAEKEKEKAEARRQAEVNLIRSKLDLALCTYEEARTYDRDTATYKATLSKAAEQFTAIHQQYRSQVGGLYARAWEGKCFEEQGDIVKAMGIYNEMLSHSGESPALKRLKDQVRQFRLICLNDEQRKDYQLVIQEAGDWLKTAGPLRRSPVGVGIQWELARAQEGLADNRATEESEKQRLLRQALETARSINQVAGEYKDPSTAMIQRLLVKLNRDTQDPQDFDTAFGLARKMVTDLKEFKDDLEKKKTEKAPQEEIQQAQGAIDAHLQETARMLSLALRLTDAKVDPRNVNQARYLLAYIEYQRRRSYDAAVLGEFVAMHAGEEESTTALEAAYMAMAAYVQAYNDAPKSDRETDIQFIVRTCNLLTSKWPDSDRANDARMNLGQIYSQLDKPADAAKWYSEVPEASPQYAQAQLAAGQAYWTAYLNSAGKPEDEKPPVEQLNQWQTSAQEHLKKGIDKLQVNLPTEGEPPVELIAAKLSLSQIMVNQGQDQQAVDLLTKDPHSVVKAVSVPDEAKRPAKGIKGRQFAAESYKMLLRAYIGMQKLDEARSTMQTLEKVVGAGGGADVTAVYVQLGKELGQELERLQETGDDKRFSEVRQAFETFLNDMYQRKDGQTFQSLNWIAETYYGLGEGSESEPVQADMYFSKAADTFADILAKAGESSGFAPAEYLPRVKLRLVNCKRRQQNFEEAHALIVEVLQQKPDVLEAQMEAAYVYQDWADSGQGDSWKYYVNAIGGADAAGTEKLIWGWGHIGNLLMRNLQTGTKNKDFEEKFLEARYNVAECRRKYAAQQGSDQKQDEELQKAEMELTATILTAGEIPEEWWARFDALYQELLRAQGKPVEPLERPSQAPAAAFASADAIGNESASVTPTQAAAPVAVPQSGSNALLWFGLAVVAGIAIVGGSLYAAGGNKRKRRRPAAASTTPAAAPPQKRSSSSRPKAAATAGKAPATDPAAAAQPKVSTAKRPKPKTTP